MNKKNMKIFPLLVITAVALSFGLILGTQISGAAAENNEDFLYACMDENGEVFGSHLPCTAIGNSICSQFDEDDVHAVIDVSTLRSGIFFREGGGIGEGLHFVLPGHVLRVIEVHDDPDGLEGDKVVVRDVVSGEVFNVQIIEQGKGSLDIDGVTYGINYFDAEGFSPFMNVDFPQSVRPWGIDLSVCF